MESVTLRELLRGPIIALSQRGTHAELGGFCEKLGLAVPDVDSSKRERMQKSYDAADDAQLPTVAENFLRSFPPSPDLRNRIQDVIWENLDTPDIPTRYRHELSRNLRGADDLFLRAKPFEDLLEQLWIIDN